MAYGKWTKPGTLTTHETPSGKITRVKDSGKLPFEESIVARRPREELEVNRIAKGGFGEAARDVDNSAARKAAAAEAWENMSAEEKGAIFGAIRKNQIMSAEKASTFDLQHGAADNKYAADELKNRMTKELEAAKLVKDMRLLGTTIDDVLDMYTDSEEDDLDTVQAINKLITNYNKNMPGTQRDLVVLPNELMERVASRGSKANRVTKQQLRDAKSKKQQGIAKRNTERELEDINVIEDVKQKLWEQEAKAYKANKEIEPEYQAALEKARRRGIIAGVSKNLPGQNAPVDNNTDTEESLMKALMNGFISQSEYDRRMNRL